jgi:hypothetical protein
MKIFVATDSSPNSKGLENSSIWDRNLIDPLRDLGHQVVRFDFDLRSFSLHANPAKPVDRAWQSENRPILERELVRQVARAHGNGGIDLFLSYFWDAHCTPTAVGEIKALGIPTINWFCNGAHQIHLVRNLAPAYDYSLVPEKSRLEDYRAMGANPVYFQEAANPTFYHPQPLTKDLDVSFVGQCYGDRMDYVAALASAGVPLAVYGPKWVERARLDASAGERLKRLGPFRVARGLLRRLRGKNLVVRRPVPVEVAHPPLSDDDMVALYSRSRISLGFSTCGDTDKTGRRIVQVRLRDMEAPMCGAFYLVERFDELGELFEYGKEIEGYADPDELVEKCRYYLAHEPERRRIQEAGRRRALAEHTWQKRFGDLFRNLGMTPRTP